MEKLQLEIPKAARSAASLARTCAAISSRDSIRETTPFLVVNRFLL